VVLTTGAFDILHLGHMMMLRDAKRLGGPRSKLVVVVASDRTVKRNKGRAAIFTAEDRKKMVEFLKPVDRALVGYDPMSFEKVLKRVKPDIVAFGYDQHKIRRAFEKYCREKNIKIRIVTLRKHRLNPSSSSDVIRKILGWKLRK